MTLYVFGDSLSYGWNFVDQVSDQHRREMCWPHMLASKLDMDLIDYTFPGCSNWRIARIIQNLKLNPDDLVIIQLAGFDRMETGVHPNYEYNSYTLDKYKIVDKPIEEFGTIVKGMCKTFLTRTSDKFFRKYLYHAYNTFWNEKWHMEINKIMITSMIYNLRNTRFIMFDGWVKNCADDEFNMPQYIMRGTNLLDSVNGDKYMTYGQHQSAVDIIEKEYNRLYNALHAS